MKKFELLIPYAMDEDKQTIERKIQAG